MAINNDRNLLEQQILTNSGLKGQELENLKARLATLSEQQLQAELSKSLAGNNRGEWYTGVVLEHSDSVVLKENHEKTTYTDDNGNEITEYKDGDTVFERTVKTTDPNGNVFETTTTFVNGRPSTRTISKNGNKTESTTFKYNDHPLTPSVTIETKKSDNSKIVSNVLEVDENGNVDNEDILDYTITTADGTETYVYSENGQIIEQKIKPDGSGTLNTFKGYNIKAYLTGEELIPLSESKVKDYKIGTGIEFDGNGNTKIYAKNGDSWERLASLFHTNVKTLKSLNPKIKGVLQAGEPIIVPGIHHFGEKSLNKRYETDADNSARAISEYVFNQSKETVFTSEIIENELQSDFKNVYDYAKYIASIWNRVDRNDPEYNAKINDLANQLIALNGQNFKYTKGQKVKITGRRLSQDERKNLNDLGFKPSQENWEFYRRFNTLNGTQRKNVTEILKQCKREGITDKAKINERIVELYPHIQLFETDIKKLSAPTKTEARAFLADLLLYQIADMANMVILMDKKRTSNPLELTDFMTSAVMGFQNITGMEGSNKNYSKKLNYLINKCIELKQIATSAGQNRDADTSTIKAQQKKAEADFKRVFNEICPNVNLDYDAIMDYYSFIQEHPKPHTMRLVEVNYGMPNEIVIDPEWTKKEQEFKQKVMGPLHTLSDDIASWAGTTQTAGGLCAFALELYLLNKAGAMRTIGTHTQAVTKFAQGANLGVRSTQLLTGVVAGAETATVFSLRPMIESIADGKVTTDELSGLGEHWGGLFKFGMFGNIVAGNISAYSEHLMVQARNSKPIMQRILTKSIQKSGAEFDKVLAKYAEKTTTMGEWTREIMNFVSNAGYMAIDEGASLTEAGGNLAQMDMISKLVAGMIGAKNFQNIPRQKILDVESKLDNYKVKFVNGKFVVKTPEGKIKTFKNQNEYINFTLETTILELTKSLPEPITQEVKKPTQQGMNADTDGQIEWRKMKIGNEEVEVTVTKNPDGSENVDFSQCRKLNTNGQYEEFVLTTERDLLNSESDAVAQPTEVTPERESVPAQANTEKLQETLDIFNQKEGLKDISDDVKTQLATLVANSPAELCDTILKSISTLKNIKMRYGSGTPDYTDEQILQITKHATNPDGTLNSKALERLAYIMRVGPGKDGFQMDKILPKRVEEINLAKNNDGFFEDDLVEIGKKLAYAHETREEIFKLLKDENGKPIKDLIELVRTDKEEHFDDGEMLLNTLKSLYTDGKLDLNKVNRMKSLVNDGVTIYRASTVMQSDMPAEIVDNIGVFNQKGLTNAEIGGVINYLKSKNIEPTFEAVKNTVENCGDIPELREIHVKQLLSQRGESVERSYYNYFKNLAQNIERHIEKNPFEASKYPKDIVGNYIKLLHIEGRSVQLKQNEIMELLYDRSRGTCPFDIDKLVDSGLLSDIPGRSEPLKLRDLMKYQKEDTNILKNAISRGLLGKDYTKLMNLPDIKGVMTVGGGGRTRLSKLTELSDAELQHLKEMDLTDLDFATASSIAKCDPEKVKLIREEMKKHGIDICTLRDFNIDLVSKLCKGIEQNIDGLNSPTAWAILKNTSSENVVNTNNLLDHHQELGISIDKIPKLTANSISEAQVRKAVEKMGKEKIANLSLGDLILACKFIELYGKKNINEIPIQAKKDLLHSLVSSNNKLFGISEDLSKDFPLIPKNQEEYCSLLPSIVRSLGIETNGLSPQRIVEFNGSIDKLSQSLAGISDHDFANMRITQEYSKDTFILDVIEKVKSLSENERQKVYDYFGFELIRNPENPTGFSISGYPRNLNNGQKLTQITDPKTKTVVEDLRPNVVRFTENNRVKCNNPQVETFLNEVIDALPELRTTIGKKQHGSHDFDVMQHSLKVMQKVTQDPRFAKLNESDKKIMMLATLMHDITKAEGSIDKTHASEGSFDSFFIAKKFNLTKEEEIKLNTLIKQHEWLEYVNSAESENELTKRLQSVAFDLHQGNLFDMAEIFTHADLKAVKFDDSFHDTKVGKSRVSFDGTVRSFGQSADIYAQRIRGYVEELKTSQPLLPQTKIPRASRINEAITHINPDGSTNIKGVYKDKDGLIIIKFNEVEDWEAIGFPKGSVSHGYEIKKGEEGDAKLADDVNTGNIKFFAHGLDYSNQLAKFDAFSLVDSDALLSVSYAERPESKYRFFRPQGVLLDVNAKYVHGGGNTDAGSGCGKSISEFKNNYIFGGTRESDRLYVSNLIKKATGMTDEQYVKFVEANKDRPIQELEPAEYREKIIKAFATINSNTRKGKREYNEMYISNPNEVMAVFAYDIDYTESIGNPVEFLNRTTVGDHEKGYSDVGEISVKERTEFLRQYALERNLPFVVFGD